MNKTKLVIQKKKKKYLLMRFRYMFYALENDLRRRKAIHKKKKNSE